eukprot:CAMPEP_0113448426 /NCGR_PEP_ID=MMETSP0014_2-20120614/4761_1 /TAXON_ID=2857 /ORGANISM="Nitzschia sp." /LENGTH=32 /DNA_ID=CAMNT_0000339639 /DNA_START=364 /DNA_END=459 /DNA_ORIENTATION=+ /assembly_acc=CAM_ASM_000159
MSSKKKNVDPTYGYILRWHSLVFAADDTAGLV